MSDLNDPLKDSYIASVGNSIGSYADELTAKGFDPGSRVKQLTGAGGLIEGAAKARKTLEEALSDAVKNEQAIRGQFYKLATETVSLAEGLLTKEHPLTQKLRGLRAELIGHQNPGGKTAAGPGPGTPTP